MRRTLPQKTDLTELSEGPFSHLLQTYNNIPHKCLGFHTSAEIFSNQVLHLKCESTFLLPGNAEVLRQGMLRYSLAWFRIVQERFLL